MRFTLLAFTFSIASKQVLFKYSSNVFIKPALFIGFSTFKSHFSIKLERFASDCLCKVFMLHSGKL